ncbi:hemolysin family protein [Microbacterium sp. YY-01]|uniref:hemolysin family protein n=1 Tax=Microbacterium sp. YY-01 TaxID=3421634 RepID=UPI003D185C32
MITAIIVLIAAVFLVAFGGLMAAIDAALSVTSQADLAEMSQQGKRAAALAKIAAAPEPHVNAVAFMRVFAETTAAVFVTVAFVLLIDSVGWATFAAAVLMSGTTFVLVGASPRSFGRVHADAMLRACAPTIRAVRVVLGPLAQALTTFGKRVTPGATSRSSFASEEQLLSMVDEAASHDLIEADDRALIHSVFDFTDQFVRAVMVHRTDMVSIDAGKTTSEAMKIFLDRGVSRMPVIGEDPDDIVGIVYLKDLVQFAFRDEQSWRDAAVETIARAAVFVPESMRAESLLQQMKHDAVHVCMVVDEHGGVAGLVTMEDLIEELVGEIDDEYDQATNEIVELPDGRYRVSSRLALTDVGNLFGLELEDDEVDSIGGLLAKVLGRVPQPGSTAVVHGLTLTGGASRGRGRGIATVFVERTDSMIERNEQDDA